MIRGVSIRSMTLIAKKVFQVDLINVSIHNIAKIRGLDGNVKRCYRSLHISPISVSQQLFSMVREIKK